MDPRKWLGCLVVWRYSLICSSKCFNAPHCECRGLCVAGCADRRRLVTCVGNRALERMRRNMARGLGGSFGGAVRQPCESAYMGIHGCYEWRKACTGTEHRDCVSRSPRGTIAAPVAYASCAPLTFVIRVVYIGVCCPWNLADRDTNASQ